MSKNFDMKKFITENRVTYPVVTTPAIGSPVRSGLPTEEQVSEEVLTEDAQKWVSRAFGYIQDAESAIETAMKEAKGNSDLVSHLGRVRQRLIRAMQDVGNLTKYLE